MSSYAVIDPANGETVEEVLRLAGSLEDASEHPIARDVSSGLTVKSAITNPTTPVARPETAINTAGPSALWATTLKIPWVATARPTSTAITTACRKTLPPNRLR